MQETHTLEKKNWAAKLLAIAVVVFMVSSTMVLFAPEASARTGTDSYGYTFKDNVETDGPTYDWIDLVASTTSTLLISSSTDGSQGPMDLPFTFEFYETEYSTWGNGGDNGFITLGMALGNAWTPYRIPATQLGNAAIAGGWFDGGFCRADNPTAGVYYDTIGTTPDRKFVVQYQDQGAWWPSVYACGTLGTSGSEDALTWQIILHEGSNEITLQYQDVNGGYYSDNEYLTVGIQGSPGGTLTGIEYSYHDSPDVPINTAVTFSPPPPARNDLRLTGSQIPDPISLDQNNLFGAEVTNKGVNCDTAGSCTPIAEADISVTASVFSIQETVMEYNFDDDDGGFVTMDGSATGNSGNARPLQGMNGWTNAANDGVGNYNYGDDGGPDDGAWSSGRKSTTLGGMFNDNDKIHYDGTDILVADRGSASVIALTTSDTVSTVIGPDTTNLANVLDVTSDDDYIYTLARSSNLYVYNTVVCKWDRTDTASPVACNSTSVRWGVALTFYDDEVFALQGGSTSTAYRKVVILDATSSSLAATGKTIDYYSGISAYSYASNMDVDEATGDMYIMYRDFYGTIRNYVRDTSTGDYCASSSCYVQFYSYSRYGHSIDVYDGYVYSNGYYYSAYYGGVRKCATSSVSITCSIMWSQFNYVQGYYRGQIAVIDNGDIYVASNYGYRYYNFWNNDDKIFVHEAGDTSGTANRVLGPNPASLAALSTPAIDTSGAMGMTMTFKTSWNFYYRYEGAYMESSTDGGLTWDHVSKSLFNTGGYYGTVFNYYANPVALDIDTWTYYNTNNAYVSYSNDAPWKSHSLNLDSFTGYDDVRFRWVAGFNQYLQTYYNSFFRLDDVVITTKEAGMTYVTETETIASLAYKDSASVSFFDDGITTFRPADAAHGLGVGDKLGVLISVADNGGDEDMSNNRAVAFREVKFVIFADNFDSYTAGGDDMGEWQTGKVKYGRSDWGVRDKDATSGSNSMDSGYRTLSQLPGDPYISTGDLDLKLPVKADIQMMISYYSYYLYDGYQMQISENSGETWGLITPVSTCGDAGYGSFSGASVIYDYAYYGNPLRGQPGYTFYGTKNTVANWAPDPQEWCKVTFDLDPYVGQSDVRFRVVAGWSTIPTYYTLYESFFRFDDLAVTGLVYNDNVGVTGLELPDPIGIDETIAVGTTVINAGINNQVANAVKLKLMIGPLGVQTLDSSNDLESYADEAAAVSDGWYASADCSTVPGNSCGSWGMMGGAPGFVFNTDEGDGDETNSWGSDGGEFQIFYGGGSTEVRTGPIDFTGAPSDLILSLKHRYNYDIYSGYPSYNGGNVKISTDGGVTWSLFAPSGGYPGSITSPTSWGNPLGGEAGFVHCGSCPNSKDAPDDKDEYITSEFDLSDYVGSTDVRFQFIAGFYMYKWPGEGEHWHIDSLTFSGTGMESIAFEEMVPITGAGAGGVFASGEAVEKVWNYHFEVPGNYKIIFDTWIGSDQALGDDFAGDNQVAAARETMFTVAGTTADETALGKKNDDDGLRMYDSDWTSNKVPGSPKNSNQWIPSSSSASETTHSPVWWAGDDAYGTPYNGDDTSLTSPVFDLSKATSAKLVFKHRFKFYGSESAFYSYYYEGGRVEISTDGGENWAGLNPTSGEGYRGMIYNYAYYGNPLSGMTGFAMSSSGGSSFVETQCRLDAYTGAGFDNLRVRFHFGGAFYDWDSNWEIDDVGIYALGFDLKQTSSSTPYTLEVGEGATITTSFRNQGQGSLGTGGTVASADAYAYVNDMSGNELWSDSEDIGALAMAYYDESGNTHGGESTDMISFTFPGMPTAGLYTIGVKVADSTGATLADLFSANNDAHHMLIVGKSAVMADPRLTGGENWAAVDNEPSDVGDGAIGVTWDETGVATEALSVSIAGQGSGYSPSAPSVQIDTTVTWTNNDIIAHTVTDKDAQFDSFEIPAGSSWQMTFTEVGVFNYYCKIHPGMEGSVTVVSSASADEQARTDYMKVWTAKSYLVFWANFDMSDDSAVSVYAQKKGSSLEDIDTVGLWGANGFTIVDGSDHSDVGDSLTGSSGWNPYYIYLDSTKLGYNSLDYDPSDDNAYAFVFRARGVQGSADIGGVQLIRTLDTGFFFAKDDESTIIYEIFPSLAVKIDYFAKNVGTEDNIFRLSPGLQAQGEAYDGAAFETSIDVKMNGAAFDGITTSENADGSWTYAFDMEPDDEAMITLRFGAPDYDQVLGEPAGNRKFDVRLSAYDVGSDENMREPITATLFIKPSQFVLGEITFNRLGVVEGASVDITVKAWNEGNYASDVLVVFYAMDSTGKAYDTLGGTGGVQRMTRVASTTVPLMAPKVVLQDQGIYQTWYFATATWDEVFIPGETVQDFETVSIYAEINPLLEQSDLDSGFEAKDEYLNQKDDNDASGEIAVVKDKVSTPSFAVGILGMSIAALVAAVGASLRREEE